jgi:tRNA (adenine37-N6)-methyltransferase
MINSKLMPFYFEPIGYFYGEQQDKYALPRQSNLESWNEGVIILNAHQNFEQALEGLEEFDRIWILFCFHRNLNWKPKVLPPRGKKKRGVFATRSPHRPNFIGLSCVSLKSVKGLKITITDHDLLDGTPILDIKPYLNYADSFASSKQGWLDELSVEKPFDIVWTEDALRQVRYLEQWNLFLQPFIDKRLCLNPFPYPNNRIKKRDDRCYELAYKSWRVLYEIVDQQVLILQIASGYDRTTLEGKCPSRWDDVPIHRAFIHDLNLGGI